MVELNESNLLSRILLRLSTILQDAAPPIELGQIALVANPSCLDPTYIRGEAYLAALPAPQSKWVPNKLIFEQRGDESLVGS
jgi:hypothetical protein